MYLKPIIVSIFLASWLIVPGQDYTTTWNHEIEVHDGIEDFGPESMYAYSVMTYEVSREQLRKLLLDEVKKYTSEKATRKKIKQGVQVTLPAFNGENLAVKVKSDDIVNTTDVKLTVAFLKGDEVVNPTDYPAGHKAARQVMRNLGVILNKAVVTEQVNESREALEDLGNKKESLLKNQVHLETTVLDGNQEVLELSADYTKLQEKFVKADSEAASLEVMANSAGATEKDIKKYSKAKSKAARMESGLLKISQKRARIESNVTQAEAALPTVNQQIEDVETQIEQKTELYNKLLEKLEAIN